MSWSKPERSEALGMKYSINDDGRVMTEDKTVYSPSEVKTISSTIGMIDSQVHNLKTVFDGEIVDLEHIK